MFPGMEHLQPYVLLLNSEAGSHRVPHIVLLLEELSIHKTKIKLRKQLS